MKKLILCTALILISLQAKLYAQDDNTSEWTKLMSRSKTDVTFNVWPTMIAIRDFVVLKEGRMIVELSDEHDYASFRNLDSILVNFRKDIAFYKDSLDANPTGSARIDYVLNDDYSFKTIRFKKYNANGNSFLSRDAEISRLKFEQDTIRIIVHKTKPGFSTKKNGGCSVSYAVQATFILGNYYDIDKVVGDKVLTGIMDTLEKESIVKRKKRFGRNPITISYNPYYTGKGRLIKRNVLMNGEFDYEIWYKKPKFSFNPQFGVGVVRSTLTPVTDIAFQYNRYWANNKERNIFRISGTGYYFFDKDVKGNFIVNDNWFINAVVGNISDKNDPSWYGREATFGVGYLVSQKGGYFKNTTMRVFTDIMIVKGVSLVPEIIATDNFKQFFPGITLKVFQ